MYIIWHDFDYDFARWIYLNSCLSKLEEKTIIRTIPKTNAKTILLSMLHNKIDCHILPAIKYETPDIIIQHVDDSSNLSTILFSTEFMTHTPQHHHPLQRFSRIYGSANLQIPTALVLPRSKAKIERKDGVYKTTMYRTNPLIYHIFLKTSEINKSPALIFLWPEKDGYLKCDKIHATAPFIDDQINRYLYFLNKRIQDHQYDYTGDSEIKLQTDLMMQISSYKKRAYTELVKKWKSIYKLETLEIIDTKKAIKKLRLRTEELSKSFLENDHTLIFKPGGLNAPSTPFRTDPYAGMLCAFDNLFCKDESNVRKINLVLRAKNIKFNKIAFKKIEHNISACPFMSQENLKRISFDDIKDHLDNCLFTMSKQQRIYSHISDIIVFDDYIYYNKL